MRRNGLSRLLLAAALLWPGAAFAAEPHWPPSLTLGTASPGGTYYAYGEGLARILTRALGLPVTMRATEGPSENIQLLEAGEIELAFVTQGVALQAWNGTGGWTGGKQLRAMRAMFPMYDTPFQFLVRQDAGIGSLAELAGKRVGVGPRGGTTAAYMPKFLKALKLEATLVNGDWAELAAQAADGTLDGLAVAAGVPFPSLPRSNARPRSAISPRPGRRCSICAWRCRSSAPRSSRPAAIRACGRTTPRSDFTISPSRTGTCRTISSTPSSTRPSRTRSF